MGHRLESVVVVERVEWGASLRPTGRPSSLAGVLGCLTTACAPTVVVAVIECPFHRTSIGGVVKNERSFRCDRITTAELGDLQIRNYPSTPSPPIFEASPSLLSILANRRICSVQRADPGISTLPDLMTTG